MWIMELRNNGTVVYSSGNLITDGVTSDKDKAFRYDNREDAAEEYRDYYSHQYTSVKYLRVAK